MSVLVGICGGSGSGKTTLADRIVERLRTERGRIDAATVLSFDSYYHDRPELDLAERAAVNYDHPASLDHELMIEHLRQLRLGRSVAVPVYDFADHRRSGDLTIVDAADVVVAEGILLFAFPALVTELDYTVFRRCPEPVRFQRRLERDVAERGRSPGSVAAQFAATVKPMHDRFVDPCADCADFVTDHGEDLDQKADEIVAEILSLLDTTPAPT